MAKQMVGAEAVAYRMENAFNGFSQVVANFGECSIAQGRAVADYYLRIKVAKMDAVLGRIIVKHGAFLDYSTIREALRTVGA